MQEPPVSVLFVENTKHGLLAKRLQEVEKRLAGTTSFRVRVTEMAGMALSRLLPSTNPWGQSDCGRVDCVICSQDDENKQDCKRRNVLYESSCTVCRVETDATKEAGKMMNCFQKDGKGLYIGESSRSLYERSKEHLRDRNDRQDDSHQVKHWLTDHPDLSSPPKFKFKLVSSFTDPLTRQIAESVRIELAGSNILNSKAEYSRCRIPRLKIDLEGWKKNKIENTIEKGDEEVVEPEPDNMIELEERSRRLESKRKSDEELENRRKKRRRKFPKLVNWGEDVSDLIQETGPVKSLNTAEQDMKVQDSSGITDWLTKHDIKQIVTNKDTKIMTRDEVLESETQKMIKKSENLLMKKKEEISKEVRKKKFVFQKRGKISKKEAVELKRTHHNIFDWVSKENRKEQERSEFEEMEGVEEEIRIDDTDLEKEARLARVEERKKRFTSRKLCKEMLDTLVEDVVCY